MSQEILEDFTGSSRIKASKKKKNSGVSEEFQGVSKSFQEMSQGFRES